MQPTITLLTDFGLQDEYVGVMKGVILSIHQQVRIVDITHGIPPHHIRQAAQVIRSAYPYFPQESIHIIVVDPGVGGKRDILCMKQKGHIFIAPDNGVLTYVIQETPPEAIYSVTNRAFFLEPVSHTFHGRDVFAAVAAHLSKGVDISELGEPRSDKEVQLFDIHPPRVTSQGHLTGEVISLDHFGNIITNIDRPIFCRSVGDVGGADIVISLSDIQIRGLSTSYEDVDKGTPLAIFGSRNLLELAVNQGNAKTFFKASRGQRVTVFRKNR